MMRFLLYLWKLLPLGKKAQLMFMRFLQDEFLVGTTGIIFNNHGEVLLFKHFYRSVPWSLPGGYLKGKEHPREGLVREIFEESGLVVDLKEQLKVRTDRETARLDLCYVGSFVGGMFRNSSEVSDARFFAVDRLPFIPKDQLLLINQSLKYSQQLSRSATIPISGGKLFRKPEANLLRRFLNFRFFG